MPKIGDTVFVVLYRNEQGDGGSVHVTRLAAEHVAEKLRRKGREVMVIGPLPATLEV